MLDKKDEIAEKYVTNTMENKTLKSVYMVFRRGEVSAIVGSSGCGKSTIYN